MSPSTPTAFVAGASGYTGRAVVAALRRRGGAVVAHLRPASPSLEWLRPELGELGAIVDTTPWELEAMTAALRRHSPGAVFGLLGTTRKRAAREGMSAVDAYQRVDYGLTALLIDAAVAAGSRPRFVFLSSLGAGSPGSNAYLAARARAEAKLSASGLPFTIVRPSFVTGPDRRERRPTERGAAAVVDAALTVASRLGARRLPARFRSRTAEQLAESLVALALDPGAENRVVESEELP